MSAAPVIALAAPAEVRVARLVADYAGIAADPAALEAALAALPRHLSKADRAEWRAMAARGETARLAAALIAAHYDPAWRRQTAQHPRRVLARVGMADGPAVAARTVMEGLDRGEFAA